MTSTLNTRPTLKPPERPSVRPWRFRPALPPDALALRENCLPDWPLQRVQRILLRAQRNALNRRGLGLVAELGGDVVGFGQITLWPNVAEISDLIVGAPWRRQGIGTTLILRLVRAAREMAMDSVEIGVALRDFDVLMLYRRLGFDYGRVLEVNLGRGPEPVMYLHMDLSARP